MSRLRFLASAVFQACRIRKCSLSPSMQSRQLSSNNSGNFGLVDGVAEEPWIPPYVEKEGESTEIKRARLLYQSRKRGMLENGLLLSTFAAKYLSTMTEPQLQQYDRLINLPSNDWEIYYWATGVRPTPLEFETEILDLFKKHVQNQGKEARLCQPDLD